MAERVSVLYKTEWNSSFQEFQARFQCIVSWLIVRSVAWFTAINSSDSLPLYVCKLSTEKLKHSLPGTKMSETIKFIKQRNSCRLICKFYLLFLLAPIFQSAVTFSYWILRFIVNGSLRPALMNVREMCYRISDMSLCRMDRDKTYL